MTRVVGRKTHSNKIKELEELVSDLGSMVGQNDEQIDRYGNMQRKLSEDIENLFEMVDSSKKQPNVTFKEAEHVAAFASDTHSEFDVDVDENGPFITSEDISKSTHNKKQPNRRRYRRRRSYFSLMRSLLYSRKTRRGVRTVAIYGTVIFVGAYVLSLLLQ